MTKLCIFGGTTVASYLGWFRGRALRVRVFLAVHLERDRQHGRGLRPAGSWRGNWTSETGMESWPRRGVKQRNATKLKNGRKKSQKGGEYGFLAGIDHVVESDRPSLVERTKDRISPRDEISRLLPSRNSRQDNGAGPRTFPPASHRERRFPPSRRRTSLPSPGNAAPPGPREDARIGFLETASSEMTVTSSQGSSPEPASFARWNGPRPFETTPVKTPSRRSARRRGMASPKGAMAAGNSRSNSFQHRCRSTAQCELGDQRLKPRALVAPPARIELDESGDKKIFGRVRPGAGIRQIHRACSTAAASRSRRVRSRSKRTAFMLGPASETAQGTTATGKKLNRKPSAAIRLCLAFRHPANSWGEVLGRRVAHCTLKWKK